MPPARNAPEWRILARGLGQQLDGDQAPQLLVFRLVDHTHSALAQRADDLVVASQCTGSKFLHVNYHATPDTTRQGRNAHRTGAGGLFPQG